MDTTFPRLPGPSICMATISPEELTTGLPFVPYCGDNARILNELAMSSSTFPDVDAIVPVHASIPIMVTNSPGDTESENVGIVLGPTRPILQDTTREEAAAPSGNCGLHRCGWPPTMTSTFLSEKSVTLERNVLFGRNDRSRFHEKSRIILLVFRPVLFLNDLAFFINQRALDMNN